MIDILIPTYNRAKFLAKNILLLNKQIESRGLQKYFRIIVSDNCSSDNTSDALSEVEGVLSVRMLRYRQEKNIGLEPNALFLLGKATSEYVMYLGDDDYLPDGYLNFVIEKIKEDDAYCIIAGFSALLPDNVIKSARNADFGVKSTPWIFDCL